MEWIYMYEHEMKASLHIHDINCSSIAIFDYNMCDKIKQNNVMLTFSYPFPILLCWLHVFQWIQ
jgi:hypothetical protein